MDPTPPSGPQKYFVAIKKEEKDEPSLHFSLGYIREYVNLQLLGIPVTEPTRITEGDTRYHTTIPGVEFNIGKRPTQADKWRGGSACNSPTDGAALCNYFSSLIEACLIKKGNRKFRWDEATLMFMEAPHQDGWEDLTIHIRLAHEPK